MAVMSFMVQVLVRRMKPLLVKYMTEKVSAVSNTHCYILRDLVSFKTISAHSTHRDRSIHIERECLVDVPERLRDKLNTIIQLMRNPR